MIILGLWDGHDAGAALLIDGQLVVAVNEERLSRRKLEPCFPHRAIGECLSLASISPEKIDHVAVATCDVAKTLARLIPATRERHYQLRRRLQFPTRLDRIGHRIKYHITQWPRVPGSDRLNLFLLRRSLATVGINDIPLHLCLHHPCHAATAAWFSGMDAATVLTLDGVGDGLSGSAWRLDNGTLHPLATIAGQDSLGLFFEHVTHLLNMRELEDEGKVMALSDHAPPIADPDNPLRSLFRVEGLTLRGRLHGERLIQYLRSILWSTSWERFAAMAQRTLEIATEQWATRIIATTGQKNLALSGGVFSNIRLNERLRRLGHPCFIFPQMGDGGLAAGAAALVQRQVAPALPIHPLSHLDLGRKFGTDELQTALATAGVSGTPVADRAATAADLIAQGKIIGWFQGRMEYGPRALGHRSILAAADHDGIKDRLNLILKRRAWYQPFCPSMLEEEAQRLLADFDGVVNPFMTMGYRFRPHFLKKFAQVAAIDGSCRPQMVRPEDGFFFQLLREVRKRTGHGVVLNTSFNLHGQPLVHTPGEALTLMRHIPLDALILENLLVQRSDFPTS
ncbi:MAG: hypothetical protein HQL76_09725 [Magnetococcales bacterium]|nr:hypothetical protein [Magnetococcales bacterium]